MATYTPNLNLGKPEATDAFGNFRQLFNANMDILDNGGGGGSGGHTIVNPSGTDMPAEGKLQFTGGVTVTDDSVNGKTVVDISGGGGNVYGAFIDTNRLITSGTYTGTLSYTATEDCFVVVDIATDSNTDTHIEIDGVAVNGIYRTSGNSTDITFLVPLKKGQTLSVVNGNAWSCSYHVYGVTQGTSGIFTPIIYSDNERVIGVWRDNKPLYAKTVGIGSLPNNATKATAHGISDIDTICAIDGIAYDGSGKTLPLGYPNVDSYTYNIQTEVNKTNVEIKTKIDFSSYTGYVTVQYTKTTDVAGSGNWNTDGVPTVHYSTSEQVIGTWIDGKPIYQCTWTGTKTTNSEEVVISGLTTLDTLVDSKVIFKGNTGAQIAQYFQDASDFGRCWYDNNGIHMDLGNSYPIRPVTWYITLQYTKTTD